MVENITNLGEGIIGLYRNDYLKILYVRKMAKLLGKSHVSLLPYLKKLEKGKILKSEISGRNKIYKLNLDNNLTKEHIIIAEKQRTLKFIEKEFFIKKIYDEILNLNLNGGMILFGSYVSGSYNKKSDIDLFYIGKIKEKEKMELKNLGKIYKKQIHLTVMNMKQFNKALENNVILIKEIIKNHLILQNPDIFINSLWRHYNGKR